LDADVQSTGAAGDRRREGLRIAMALYGDITYDSRVMREAETLARAGHSVTVFCLAGTAGPGRPFGVVARMPGRPVVLPDGSSPFLRASPSSGAARMFDRIRWIFGYALTLSSWGRWAVASAGDVDVWHAHDLTGLMAVGPFVRRRCRQVYDSHEIFVETGTGARLPGPLRRALSAYEGVLARRAVVLITVNEGYEEVLRRRLRPRRTLLVRNCPPSWTPRDHPARLRIAAGVPPGSPLLLYHGLLADHRGIDELVAAMLQPGMGSTHAAFLGFGPRKAQLEQLAGEPRFGGRLHVLDAVPPEELLEWVAGADVDVIALQPSTLNHRLCTPNKLWESLGAGVPVVVSDFAVMRRIVLDDPAGPLGAVCNPGDPASIAAAIRGIVERPENERAALRARCLRAAHERWNWESEGSRLVGLYTALRQAARSGGGPGRTPAVPRARVG
jgi:glycosyltransferase involved in cell wall biosynthesis